SLAAAVVDDAFFEPRIHRRLRRRVALLLELHWAALWRLLIRLLLVVTLRSRAAAEQKLQQATATGAWLPVVSDLGRGRHLLHRPLGIDRLRDGKGRQKSESGCTQDECSEVFSGHRRTRYLASCDFDAQRRCVVAC